MIFSRQIWRSHPMPRIPPEMFWPIGWRALATAAVFALFIGVLALVFGAAKWVAERVDGDGGNPLRRWVAIVVAAFIVFCGYVPTLVAGLMVADHLWQTLP